MVMRETVYPDEAMAGQLRIDEFVQDAYSHMECSTDVNTVTKKLSAIRKKNRA
jgi:hypothetical protein